MDYEELMTDLNINAGYIDDGKDVRHATVAQNMRDAITAIQTLLVERDQARARADDESRDWKS